MLWLLRRLPWFADRIVLPGISAWFFLHSAAARAASREYLALALGRPAAARDVFRHIHLFARSILDRAYQTTHPNRAIRVEVCGLQHVEALAQAGRGGVLLGSHLGSFAALQALAQQCPVPVKMLLHQANAGAFTTILARQDPAAAANVIPIGNVRSMLLVQEAVSAGALVGMLADRAPSGSRMVTAPFFGRPAPFPAGPFILAASLGVPVLTFRSVRLGPQRYRAEFTPFCDRIVLQRHTREADLAAAAARYAGWLEEGCRAYPYQWFNFYPFWQAPPRARGRVARLAKHGSLGRHPALAD